MTNETEKLLNLPTSNVVCVDKRPAEDRARPLWWQIQDLIEHTRDLAHQDFVRDIAWMERRLEKDTYETLDGCLMRLTGTGLEFHDVEIWHMNKQRDSDYPAIEWDFQPGDTVGWAHDLLLRHRDEIVRWLLIATEN